MTTISKPLPASDKPISRREFLYSLGGASLALLSAGTCGSMFWYTIPVPPSGTFPVDMRLFTVSTRFNHPTVFWVRDAPAYVALIDEGLVTFDTWCVYEKDRYPHPISVRWLPTRELFVCPGCGTYYRADGTHIEGPSRRGLDRFGLRVRYPDGTIITSTDGTPIPLQDATEIVVDTNHVTLGAPRSR